MTKHGLTIEQRFLKYVVKVRGGCWLWQGATHKGYGQFSPFPRHGTVRAHRWAYEQWVGPIPPGLTLDHLCHDPAQCPGGVMCPHRRCVRPSHLKPEDRGANTLRGNGPTAQNARRTHCQRGHALVKENLMSNPNRGRECRLCANHREREKRAKAKG